MTPRLGCVAISGRRKTPILSGTSAFSRDKSGLITSQLLPPLLVLNSTLPARYRTCGSTGENIIGAVRRKRYLPLRNASGATFCTCPVVLSNLVALPPYIKLGLSGSG